MKMSLTKSLHWDITKNCNLRCKHCYGDFKPENYHHLNIDDLDNLISDIQNDTSLLPFINLQSALFLLIIPK